MTSTNAHFPIICRLSKNAIPDLVAIENETDHPHWNKQLFSGEFENRCARFYGARLGGELVGFLLCHVVADEGHILNLAVRRGQRRAGIARELVSYVLQELHLQAIKWVSLEVRKSNDPARLFYESLGFIEVGERSRYYSDNGEDASVLSLNVRQFIDEFGDGQPPIAGNW